MDFSLIANYLPKFFDALGVTLYLVTVSVLLGFFLAVPLSVIRANRTPILNGPVWAFTYFFRGTPLLIQLYMFYYGLGQMPFMIELTREYPVLKGGAFFALVAFTLNTAAYTTEIIRGAIEQTPFGEVEAAKACGMTKFTMYRRIILPSALRRALPAYSNEVIFMLHGSAIASTVTLTDLLGAGRNMFSKTYMPYESYITAGAFYFCLTFLILWGFRIVEKRVNKHLKRREEHLDLEPVT